MIISKYTGIINAINKVLTPPTNTNENCAGALIFLSSSSGKQWINCIRTFIQYVLQWAKGIFHFQYDKKNGLFKTTCHFYCTCFFLLLLKAKRNTTHELIQQFSWHCINFFQIKSKSTSVLCCTVLYCVLLYEKGRND